MEQTTLSFTVRSETRKGAARRLRRAGQIPSVVYGRRDPLPIAVSAHEFATKFKTVSESSIIRLVSDGASMEVLVKDYQEDIVTGRIEHIDFYEIDPDRTLRTHVAIHLAGIPQGVREGGLLETLVHEIEVECLPKDLPSQITVDVTALQIGHSIHVRDLRAPEGVRLIASPDQVVCTVLAKRAEVEPAAVEAAAGAEEAAAGAEEAHAAGTDKRGEEA